MKKFEAKQLFEDALVYVGRQHSEELAWARGVTPETFNQLDARSFLQQYCWVIYAAGFKKSILEKKFEGLQGAFHNFDLATVAQMRSADAALAVINHKAKGESFLRGAKLIYEEGFENFKARVRRDGMAALRTLPYIGEITQRHLAKNIGLADMAKNDIHMERLARHFHATSVDSLTSYLAAEVRETQHVVDLVLWQYCADGLWRAP